jgi:hypothetical protein
MSARQWIGRYSEFATRYVVFMTDQAIESDELDNFEVARRRVLFEDVLLVTLHENTAVLRIILSVCIAIFAFFIAAVVRGTAGWWFAAFGTPIFLYALARGFVKETVMTVFGRRSVARVRFGFRRARARATFGEVCTRVRRAQRELAAEIGEGAGKPAEEVPAPPAEFAAQSEGE